MSDVPPASFISHHERNQNSVFLTDWRAEGRTDRRGKTILTAGVTRLLLHRRIPDGFALTHTHLYYPHGNLETVREGPNYRSFHPATTQAPAAVHTTHAGGSAARPAPPSHEHAPIHT